MDMVGPQLGVVGVTLSVGLPEVVTEHAVSGLRAITVTDLGHFLDLPVPIVGAFQDLEQRGNRGRSFPNSHDPHLHGKEGEGGYGVRVEPADGRKVRPLKLPGNPDDRLRFQPRQVGQDLPQVRVVSVLQLVLNHYHASVAGDAGQYVR